MSVYPKRDAWCEAIICEDGAWSTQTSNEIGISPLSAVGLSSVYIKGSGVYYYWLSFFLNGFFNSEIAHNLNFALRLSEIGDGHFSGVVNVSLMDVNGNGVNRKIEMLYSGAWTPFTLEVGSENAWMWKKLWGNIDWTKIKAIRFIFEPAAITDKEINIAYVDDLHFTLKQAYAFLWIRSQPIQGVPFNIDGSPGKTDIYAPQIPGTEVTVSIAQTFDSYTFDHWDTPWGTETTPTITFTIWEDMTITAHFAGPPPTCESYTTEAACTAAGCYWWDNACHSSPPPSTCESYTTEEECTATGCYWYDDACHSSPKPPPKPPTIFDQLWRSFTDFLKKLGLPAPPKPPSPPS